MKSLYIIVFCCIGYLFLGSVNAEEIKVPDYAIRFRVIASSNSPADQQLKMKVKLKLERELSNILENTKNFQTANDLISNNLNVLENSIKSILKEEKSLENFKVNFGKNYFPEKEYNGIKYDEGNYHSLTVTLGNGLGDNWWCILFPPLCLLDDSDYSNAEYKMFVKEIVGEYLN